PLHALALPRSRADADAPSAGVAAKPARTLPAHGPAFVLVAAAFAAYAFVPSGLAAHLLAMFQRLGLEPGMAVAIGALFGPSQVAARLLEFLFARNVHPLVIARFAVSLLVGAFLLMAALGLSTPVAALFAVMF